MSGHVFISHSSKDKDFVKELLEALEGLGLKVWRDMLDGAEIPPSVKEAIENARQFIAVISPSVVNSRRVRVEINVALKVERARKDEGYRVIPLLLPGIEPSALALWFDEEPIGIPIKVGAGGLAEALPALLAALGERLPDDVSPDATIVPPPVAELILRLNDLQIESGDGKRRARAVAQLVYEPADRPARSVESRRFNFTAPLGVVEAEELRWYLEEFYIWPIGIFQERAARIEARLPVWGEDLYRAAFAPAAARETLGAWQQVGDNVELRFSVFVDSSLIEGASEKERSAAREAAAELLALPWELLHDGRGFLFHGKRPVRVRRRLPNLHSQRVRPTRLPVRILLISPRPESEYTPFFDHRASAMPLVEALESLGELAELSILTPPTFAAFEEALQKSDEAGEHFDVVHFDGHGIYDRKVGLGALCFEDPADADKLGPRAFELVHAERVAEVIRDHRIPLVFLEASQTAKTDADPTASVAAKLLEEGAASVVAMSHMTLLETARRFVKAFYGVLVSGGRIGTAMIAGQRELHRDDYRGKRMGAGELRLQDWFVPVLYQEEQDPRLVVRLPPAEVLLLQATRRRLSLGRLPDPPPHEFQGRSRELLALERLLTREPYAVVRGPGGSGKTVLIVELARWLVRTRRYARAAFVSLEQYTEERGVLDTLGKQLLPEGDGWSVANYSSMEEPLQYVERALRDRPTVIVLDNVESILPDQAGQQHPPGAAPVEEFFSFCLRLLNANPATRIVFTTREPLPPPFDDIHREIVIGPLSREDAVALVGEVMRREGVTPRSNDPGADPQEITELVEAVDRHALSLVLLTREVAFRGVRATAESLEGMMAELQKRYPGDREYSPYASVEASLRRLSPETREQARALAVFHGGAQLSVLAHVLGTEDEAAVTLAKNLVAAGLAQGEAYGYLRLDPALPSYLRRELSAAEFEAARDRWAVGMKMLAEELYLRLFSEPELAASLARSETANLVALLEHTRHKSGDEDEFVYLAEYLEALFTVPGTSSALSHVVGVREQTTASFEPKGKWSRARFVLESENVGRHLAAGDVQAADTAALRLLERCRQAGEKAYEGADFDFATAHYRSGQTRRAFGDAEAALQLFDKALRRFRALSEYGDGGAALMTYVVMAEVGDCHRDAGRLDDAAAFYQESLSRAESAGDSRHIAAVAARLGTTFLLRQDFAQALASFEQARSTFQALGDQTSFAAALHQIGITYRLAGKFDAAETMLRESLVIKVQTKDAAGEARTLAELGNLYGMTGRLESALSCYRQAIDIYMRLQDARLEGAVRNNLAVILAELQRFEEARSELREAIARLDSPALFTQQWKTWAAFYHLERAADNMQVAALARQKAFESFTAFRRAGGANQSPGAALCARVTAAVESGETAEVEHELLSYLGPKGEAWAKTMIPKLQAILGGVRDKSLFADPELDYDDAVELQLLLEYLDRQPQP